MVRNDDILKGVAIGIGVAVLVPLAVMTLAPVVKPLARTAMKAGIRAYEKSRESLETFGESIEDIVAEVEEEMVDARAAKTPTAEVEEVFEEAASVSTER